MWLLFKHCVYSAKNRLNVPLNCEMLNFRIYVAGPVENRDTHMHIKVLMGRETIPKKYKLYLFNLLLAGENVMKHMSRD